MEKRGGRKNGTNIKKDKMEYEEDIDVKIMARYDREYTKKRNRFLAIYFILSICLSTDYSAKTENIHSHFIKMGREVLILSQK